MMGARELTELHRPGRTSALAGGVLLAAFLLAGCPRAGLDPVDAVIAENREYRLNVSAETPDYFETRALPSEYPAAPEDHADRAWFRFEDGLLVGGPFDFEAAGDADGDNVYRVVVLGDDSRGVESLALFVTVTVTDENEAPALTGPEELTVPGDMAVEVFLSATDPDGDALSFSLGSRADEGLFTIDDAGVLRAPGFDASMPRDADRDGVYEVEARVSDGELDASQQLRVTVRAPEGSGPTGPGVFAVVGAEGGARFGNAVAGVDDMDGDGLPDLVVGEPGVGAHVIRSAAFLDAEDRIFRMDDFGRALGVTLAGEGLDDFGLGVGSAAPGDAARSDVLVTRSFSDAGPPGSLVAVVNLGDVDVRRTTSAEPHAFADIPGDPSSFLLLESQDFDGTGAVVAELGDLDRDERRELLVCAPSYDGTAGPDSGAAFVVFGDGLARTRAADVDGRSRLDDLVASGEAVRIDGRLAFGQGCDAADAVGDVDGDGVPDLAVAESGADRGAVTIEAANVGRVTLLSGADVVAARPAGTLALASGISFEGAREGDEAGTVVRGVGDVDGDGTPDLFIAGGGAGLGADRAYVVFGGRDVAGLTDDTGVVPLDDAVTAGAALALEGNAEEAPLAFDALLLGDLDGDGLGELAISTARSSAALPRVFIVTGAALRGATAIDLGSAGGAVEGVVVTGLRPGEETDISPGLALGRLGSVDGDALPELVLGDRRPSFAFPAPNGEVVVVTGARLRREIEGDGELVLADALDALTPGE